jgi:hypothetical protein
MGNICLSAKKKKLKEHLYQTNYNQNKTNNIVKSEMHNQEIETPDGSIYDHSQINNQLVSRKNISNSFMVDKNVEQSFNVYGQGISNLNQNQFKTNLNKISLQIKQPDSQSLLFSDQSKDILNFLSKTHMLKQNNNSMNSFSLISNKASDSHHSGKLLPSNLILRTFLE